MYVRVLKTVSGVPPIAAARPLEHGPKAANKFVYYVDHDWNMPIGYLFFAPDELTGPGTPALLARL